MAQSHDALLEILIQIIRLFQVSNFIELLQLIFFSIHTTRTYMPTSSGKDTLYIGTSRIIFLENKQKINCV